MNNTNQKWPTYKDTMLIVGNPKSQVAVCALWTKKEYAAGKLNMGKIAVIGNLYSPKKGISFLLRNLCANPNIRNLVICGLDNSKSGQAVIDFFNNGFDKTEDKNSSNIYWRAKSEIENRIDIEIDESALELIRKNVKILDFREENDYRKINNIIEDINQNLLPYMNKPLFFPDPPKKESNFYPSESTAHVIRGAKIAEVWIKILDEILRFGITDQTAYQNQQKEIIDIISIVEDEDPNNLYIPVWLPNDKEHLKNYLPTILSGNCPAGSSYTYGSRMRNYFGVDQIQKVIDEIKREKYSRRAVINLLDPKVDCDSKNPPCLNHSWFRIQSDKLHMVATLRSNDMFEAWTENAFGLRMLQNLVYKEVLSAYPEIKLGDLVIHSLSAHIYDDSWEEARNIIEKYQGVTTKHTRCIWDPRGNFIIKVENKEIVVEHYSSDEILLNTYRDKKAMPIYLKISKDKATSIVSHALYLGTELQKAEEAIKLGAVYEQDKPINLDC